jgi:transcriptional regulator with XRE-family HTH domain
MAVKERHTDRGAIRAQRLLIDLGRELREARMSHGLSQRAVGRAVGISASQVSRIERARVPGVSFGLLAKLLAVVGLELSARAYPAAGPLRDRAHLDLLARLRTRLSSSLEWRTEVPLPNPGDPRAWDVVIGGQGWRCAVEAETRPRDLQALERRLGLKQRDGGVERVLLLLASTRTNRHLLREQGEALKQRFPLSSHDALEALAAGKRPASDALILL